MTLVLCLQLTTGCASVSFLNGMAPAFHGTILVQNPGHKQSVTLEFQERSAWRMLTSNRGVKDGVRLHLQCPLGSFIACAWLSLSALSACGQWSGVDEARENCTHGRAT